MFIRTCKTALLWLAGAEPLFWLMPWLMALLTLGTVAQRYIGLYDALDLFFHSWVLWIGPIPTPGGFSCLALLTLSLTLKLLMKTRWNWDQAGVIAAHLGVLLLLAGGAYSHLFAREGYVMLLPGETRHSMQDYFARELVLKKNGEALHRWPETALAKGPLTGPASLTLPFTVTLEDYCRHCAAFEREGDMSHLRGIARKVLLKEGPPAKEREENKGGVTLAISGLENEQDGVYIATEQLPSQAPEITVGDDTYRLELQRAETPLPFRLTLQEFKKFTYPGSQEAREYASSLTVVEEGKEPEEARIAMNEPLRLQGYALYQSSFVTLGDGTEASVLAVVKNDAWIFPYLSGLVLVVGLGWHMAVRWQRKRKEGGA